MYVEFIGCTGAGKSTLVGRVLAICRARGVDAWTEYDFVLRQLRLEWVTGRLPRGLLVNLIALCAALWTWRANRAFYRFAARLLARLPAEVSWYERLYIGRDVLKNIGIYAIVRRRSAPGQLILLDEGPLHTAHYLFVHRAVEPDLAALDAFARLAPLPDLLVYVTQSAAVLVERTMARGHKRIPDRTPAKVAGFVGRAIAVFERLARQPALADRLLVVDGGRDVLVGQSELPNAAAAVAARLIWAGEAAGAGFAHTQTPIAP
ncbi:MAG: hypothetical protein IPO81_10190 [Kouleothrix sp.]|nr:hypothetical protein [Kouleothrix sp.]